MKQNMITKGFFTGDKMKSRKSGCSKVLSRIFMFRNSRRGNEFKITPPSGKIKKIQDTFLYDQNAWWRNRPFMKGGVFAVLIGAIATVGMISTEKVSAHSLTITTSGAQNIDVSVNGTGTAISADSVTVTTTCKAGYNLTLATSVNDNNLYLDGSASNNTAGTFFSPADGTTILSSARNTWGYYLPANGDDTPTANSVFSPVPVLGSPVALKTASQTASETEINDTFPVYYGVSVSNDMVSGAYKMIKNGNDNDGALVYYATLSEDCFKYTVHFDPTGTNLGTAITGTGTVADQSIMEGVATNLTTSVFDNPTVGGITYYFAGWNTEQNGRGRAYTSGQSVTNLATAGNTITLYAQWEEYCPSGKICYRANGDNVEGTMGNQTVSASVDNTMLLATNYSRAGYGFAGWSTKANAVVNENFGNIMGPSETYYHGLNRFASKGQNLYAIWVASVGNMQTWSGCSSMEDWDVTALTDQRDGQVYTVYKSPDGNCWMSENLRLEASATTGDTNKSLAQGYGTTSNYGNFIGLANSETVGFVSTGNVPANSIYYSGTQSGTATINVGISDYPNHRLPRYVSRISSRANNPTTNSAQMYGYGNFYNWPAAAANTNVFSGTIDVTSTSICPKGWRLPTKDDISSLDIEFGGDGYGISNNASAKEYTEYWREYPTNMVYAGYFWNGSVSGIGTNGKIWTSSHALGNVYTLLLNDNNATYSRYAAAQGNPVRCVKIQN